MGRFEFVEMHGAVAEQGEAYDGLGEAEILGVSGDAECTSVVIAVYERKNLRFFGGGNEVLVKREAWDCCFQSCAGRWGWFER